MTAIKLDFDKLLGYVAAAESRGDIPLRATKVGQKNTPVLRAAKVGDKAAPRLRSAKVGDKTAPRLRAAKIGGKDNKARQA